MAEKAPQTFDNHTRWDPLFHFFLLPVFGLGLVLALIHFSPTSWKAISAITSTRSC